MAYPLSCVVSGYRTRTRNVVTELGRPGPNLLRRRRPLRRSGGLSENGMVGLRSTEKPISAVSTKPLQG